MKLNCRKLAANLCLLALTILSAAYAGAQLSGSLSPALDSNLNGLDSSVAPVPSTEIEPGASNLLTPEEHVLPYDSIGASIESTALSPSLTRYSAFARVPFQIDGSIRDSTLITGQRGLIPINVVDIIGGRSGKEGLASSLQPGASSFGDASRISFGLGEKIPPGVNGMPPGALDQRTSWMAGSTSAALPPLPTTQLPEQTSTAIASALTGTSSNGNPSANSTSTRNTSTRNTSTRSDASRLNRERNGQSEKTGGDSTASMEPAEDYSRSPLEAANGDGGDLGGGIAASPFDSLDQKSFLSPDITSVRSRRTLAKGESTRTQSESALRRDMLGSRSSGKLSDQGMTRGMTRAESRLLKESSRTEPAKRAKWHNPILQQMENEASSIRQ